MNGATEFSYFIASLGFKPPARIEPGRWTPFSTSDRHGDTAGRARLFADQQGGYVYDWRTGSGHVWQAQRTKDYSEAERRTWRERIERERKEAEALRDQERKQTAERARVVWDNAKPAPEDHPYLVAKGVQSHGLRLYRGPLALNGMRCDGALLIPARTGGEVASLQFIAPTGEKRHLNGSKPQGCYFAIGKPDAVLLIAEGYATAASLHAATGSAVAVAFDAGSLEAVAKAMREKLPNVRLILCADNDIHADGTVNTGVVAATKAAQAVGGLLAVPDMGGTKCDFNDLAKAKGAAAVKQAIDAATSPSDQRTPAADDPDCPEPEKLPELPEVPPFNPDVLPGVLRAFVSDIAERKQCPGEFPAVGAVVMAGAAIGSKIGIRPKQFDPWTVVPNLWGAIIGKSGIMKSPALSDAIAPLKRMQAKAFEDYEQAKAAFELAERAAKIKAADAEKRAKEAYAKDRSADLSAYLAADAAGEEPKPRRYIVNDSSPEALCETLKDNPHGVLCERDELIGLLRSMDKEGAQEARALYLTAADGDKSFTVDRIMRGSGRHVERVCVSIVGGIQPGVLAGYVRETQRGGAGDDGLLQRFGLMVYPDLGKYRHVDRPEDREAKEAVYQLIERLCALNPADVGAEVDPYGGIPYLRFSTEAQALFVEWLDDLEGRIRTGEDHPAITSHLSKYRKNVPALALINHLCEGGTGPVSKEALGRALLFIELLEAHARRVYSYASRPELDAAKTIMAKLRSGKLPVEFTARQVYRSGWAGLTGVEETGAALRVLTDYGHLSEHINKDTGGKPSTTYRAHPSIKAGS